MSDTQGQDQGQRDLMLISSSISPQGYLAHCAQDLGEFLDGCKEVCFIPYALSDWNRYEALAGERFQGWGVHLSSVHRSDDPGKMIRSAEVIFVGGGNTFVLLRELQKRRLVADLRATVGAGAQYIGSSAGANIAGPNIRTTNDMPILPVRSLKSLGLVPFNINPHYTEVKEGEAHMGETRDERIRQFLEYNGTVVVGLFEDSYLRIRGEEARVCGGRGARIFRKDSEALDVPAGGRLDDLMRSRLRT